jgi:hypothetical protein
MIGRLRLQATDRAIELGSPEGVDGAVGGHQPVAGARGADAHDRLARRAPAGVTGVTEGEHGTVGRRLPVPPSVGGTGHADDGAVG